MKTFRESLYMELYFKYLFYRAWRPCRPFILLISLSLFQMYYLFLQFYVKKYSSNNFVALRAHNKTWGHLEASSHNVHYCKYLKACKGSPHPSLDRHRDVEKRPHSRHHTRNLMPRHLHKRVLARKFLEAYYWMNTFVRVSRATTVCAA